MVRLRTYQLAVMIATVISLQFIINYFWISNSSPPGLYYNSENDQKHRKNMYTLFIIVLSAVENLERRNAIRETWLNPLRKLNNVKYTFVVGRSKDEYLNNQLDQEHGVHKDILLLSDIADNYGSLTGKVVESFKWVHKNIPTDYVLKCDDDSFVRIDKLLETISKEEMPKTRLYWGYFRGRSSVKRTGKWAENEWNLCDKYLPFAFGGGYILSSDLVHYITLNSKYLRKFNNEDVTIGAWLSVLDITRKHDTRFNTEAESRGCSNAYLVSHKDSPENMREKDKNIVETGKMCSQEFNSYPGYIYNWNVLPSYCCHRLDGIE